MGKMVEKIERCVQYCTIIAPSQSKSIVLSLFVICSNGGLPSLSPHSDLKLI